MSFALRDVASEVAVEAIELRHELHSFPEPSTQETRTSATVREALVKHGVPRSAIKPIAGTGLVVDLRGTAPAPDGIRPLTILLRTELDALPMSEANPDLPYRSQIDGCAHMCGHDGHMAVMVGAAAVLVKALDRLPETACVRLLFQPAEETGEGAVRCIEEGALDDVDEAYAFHCYPFGSGVVRVLEGPSMAQISQFRARIIGRGGHGSEPSETVDSLVAACHTVVALQTIVSRNIHPLDSAVVTVGMVQAGDTDNIIPECSVICGSIRTFKPAVYETVRRRLIAIVQNTARAFGARAEVSCNVSSPGLVNNPTTTQAVVRAASLVVGKEKVSAEGLPVLGSDDFATVAQKIPSTMFCIGVKPRARNHAPSFDFDDDIVQTGIEIWARLVEDRFEVSLFD